MLADRIRMINMGKPKVLIDRFSPTTVVASGYSTAGNGGRKLVRLDNGWLVAGTFYSVNNYIYLYISKNSGETFSLFSSYSTSGSTINDFTLSSCKNTIYVMFGVSNTTVRIFSVDSNGVRSGVVSIDTTQTSLGKCSSSIDPQGTELHACWTSKNATYPNSFNIRYCKGTINGDGSVAWGSVEQVTKETTSLYRNYNPSILVVNSSPVITVEYKYSTTIHDISSLYKDTPTTWKQVRIYGTSYAQTFPSACIDKDGVIHVAWHGLDSTHSSRNGIFYSKSVDGGITWSNPISVFHATSSFTVPSITVNKDNVVFMSTARDTSWDVRSVVDGVFTLVQNFSASGASLNPSSLMDNTLEFDIPLTINGGSSYVKFWGKWYE